MSQYTQGPKLLRRSRTDRYIGGVCGGVAAYLNMDATLVRILTVALTLFTGVPVVLYLVALFFMPEEDVTPAPPVGPGGDAVWGAGGPPWAQQQPGAQPPAAPWTTPTPAPMPTEAGPSDPPRREDGAL
jgi:phage shock protein PspC (stress-responsive transcriptional regulator)